jgi:hypothetical protein
VFDGSDYSSHVCLPLGGAGAGKSRVEMALESCCEGDEKAALGAPLPREVVSIHSIPTPL